MPIVAKSSGNSDFEPISAGLHHSVCYGIIDLGTQPSNSPQFKPARKVVFLYEVPEERITIEGKDLPRGISAIFTLSLASKSKLRPALESWRGKPFTDEELEGFDITKVLGANAFLNVVHATKGEKTYANVSTINPIPKGVAKKTAENKLVQWSISDQPEGPIKVPEGVPDWIKAKIMLSEEYIASQSQSGNHPPSQEDVGPGQTVDEDVPF
jgi:hypothetical protein